MINININFPEINNLLKTITSNSTTGASLNQSNQSKKSKKSLDKSIYHNQNAFSISNSKLNALSIEIMSKSIQIQSNRQEILNILIYERFILRRLLSHYENMLKEILKSEEMNLNNIKFKNLYLIDVSNERIVFDYMKSKGVFKAKEYFRNEKVWQEILYHSGFLMKNYLQEYGFTYFNIDDNHKVSDYTFIDLSILYMIVRQT